MVSALWCSPSCCYGASFVAIFCLPFIPPPSFLLPAAQRRRQRDQNEAVEELRRREREQPSQEYGDEEVRHLNMRPVHEHGCLFSC